MHELFTYNLDDMWALPDEEKEVNFSRYSMIDLNLPSEDMDSVWVCECCDEKELHDYYFECSFMWAEDRTPQSLARGAGPVFCEICGRCSNPHCDCQEHC